MEGHRACSGPNLTQEICRPRVASDCTLVQVAWLLRVGAVSRSERTNLAFCRLVALHTFVLLRCGGMLVCCFAMRSSIVRLTSAGSSTQGSLDRCLAAGDSLCVAPCSKVASTVESQVQRDFAFLWSCAVWRLGYVRSGHSKKKSALGPNTRALGRFYVCDAKCLL